MAAPEEGWTLLGWQGIAFEIPGGWSLAASSGDRTRGGIRLEDDLATRAEVTWQPVHRKRTLEEVAAAVRKRFEAAAAKRRQSVTIDESGLKLKRRNYVVLRCRAEAESLNLVTLCETCRRAVVASVFYRPGERKRMAPVAERLFQGLSDHPKGEREVWAVYGVRIEIPTGFHLAGSSLQAGLVDLSFIRRDWQIDVLRSSMADVQLRREEGLAQWFVRAYARRLKDYATTSERTEFRGHAALSVVGSTKVARRLLRPLRPRDRAYVLAWHCQVTDKLFIVRLSAPEDAAEEFDRLLATVPCH